MWSGPRNISTAMMRAFGARADCAVTDEPFYAAYLVATGLIHPMRDEVIASQPTDWRAVAGRARRAAAGGQAGLVPEAHDPPHAAAIRPGVDATASSTPSSFARPRPCSPPMRASATTSPSTRSACRPRPNSSTAPPTGSAAPRRSSRPGRARRPAGHAFGAVRGVRRSLRRRDAVVAARAARTAMASGRRSGTRRSSSRPASRRRAAELGFDDLPDALKPIAAAARPIYERLARHKLSARTKGCKARQIA